MPAPTTLTASPPDLDDLPVSNVIAAEADAIRELCRILANDPSFPRASLLEWLQSRGWDYRDYLRWRDRISGHMASKDNEAPNAIKLRLASRLERIAHGAEATNEFGAAVKATEAEARLHGIAIDAKTSASAVTVTVNAGSAALVSDEQLLAIANSKPVEAIRVETETQSAPQAHPSGLID